MLKSWLQRLVPLGLVGLILAGAPLARCDEADDQYAVAAGNYGHQRWKLAADEFQVFLRAYPQHPKAAEACFFLGESLLQLRQLDRAEPQFREYLQRQPEGRFSPHASFRLGETAFLLRRNSEAQTTLAQFVAQFPEDELNAFALVYLGDLALSAGQADTARKYYQDALERFPQGRMQDDCRLGLGQALERLALYEDAERMYLALSGKAASPLAPDAQLHLARLLYERQRWNESLEAFDAFQQRWPDHSRQTEAALGRGWCLFRDKRLDDAEAVFRSLVEAPTGSVTARYWLGLTQKAKDNFPAAAKTLLAAAEVAPKNHPLQTAFRFHAGDALLRTGDTTGAIWLFDQVVANTTDTWADDAARGRIQAALTAKDWPTLDRLTEKFPVTFAESPLKPDVQRLRGRSLLERKQYARAVEVLESLVAGHQSPVDSKNTSPGRNPVSQGPLLAPDEIIQQRLEDRYLLSLAYEGVQRYDDALAAILPVADQAAGRLKADSILAKGSMLLAIRRYAEAIDPLTDYLSGDVAGDDMIRARAGLAICLARTGRLEHAKTTFAELVAATPRSELIEAATEQLSEAAYDAGDGAWAAELFDRLARASPASQQEMKALSGQAWSQWKAKQLPEAAATFDRLLKKAPPPEILAEAALARAQILQELGQADGALATYDLVIRRCSKSDQYPQALLAAARLYAKLEQPEPAAKLLQRLVRELPKLPELDAAIYELAWVLRDLHQDEESIAMLQRLHDQHTQSRYWADATYRLAQQALEARDFDRADKLVSELLATKPETELQQHARFLQGQLAAATEQWDRVHRLFEQFLRDFPASPLRAAANYWVAEALFRKGDYAAAGERLERLVTQIAESREAWVPMVPLRRAQVLAHLERWSEAYQIASQIERQYPGFPQQYEVDYLRGRCLADRAEFDEARHAYQQVIRSSHGAKTETAAMAQWMIGESYFHQKNYDAALREYLRLEILYAYPKWQALALLQAGKCHELLGQMPEAVKLYTRLVDTYNDTVAAEEAARRLRTSPRTTTASIGGPAKPNR